MSDLSPLMNGSMDPTLDVAYATQRGQRFYPITHRRAIYGLAVDSLVLSESVDVEIDAGTNTITLNPLVLEEFEKVDKALEEVQTYINETVTTAITELQSSIEQMNYAGSTSPAGAANSAAKLETPINLSLTGDATGTVLFDGSADTSITVALANNYAGSDSAGGAANSAAKLETPFTLIIAGSVTGSASIDGSGEVTLTTETNHTHSAYALTTHNHSGVYATASHNHSGVYYPVTGGTVSGSITVTGSMNSPDYYDNGEIGYLVGMTSTQPSQCKMWAW